ncbi:MAG: putative RNA-binding protein (virulence factor B family) [Chlamydiales bacterium]|jgi:predicted RNA-binding protein (virulence factor B family)
MIYLGEFNTLIALRKSPFGMFLGEVGDDQEVLLPNKYLPKDLCPKDPIDVFLYTDSEDRIVATTLTPKILLHQFATLEVKDATRIGAFLDWGLEKDLFLPFAEQKARVKNGDKVTVFLLLDESSDRLIASSRIREFTDQTITVKEGEEVDLLVDRKSELGFQVIINNKHIGLIFANEVFQSLSMGDKLKGFIKKIREDGKIDVSLQKQGYTQINDSQDLLLKKLQDNNGVLYLTDKSDPKLITQKLMMSKKAFKKSVGALYKQKIITIKEDRIILNSE